MEGKILREERELDNGAVMKSGRGRKGHAT